MNWLGIDVGGANLKISDGDGFAASLAFALWKQPQELPAAMRGLLADAPASDGLAVTMTGELADCFATKAEGVRFILYAASAAAGLRTIRVYIRDGRFVPPALARADPQAAAASNWHALARFSGRYAPAGAALLVDLGSTTCDIIPLVDGQPRASGHTDTSRLLAGELGYTGIERSPVCAITDRVSYRGQLCPVAQELFATARDVYLVLEELAEQPQNTDTADGRPATRAAALARLGRVICADGEEFNEQDGMSLACAVADAQAARLAGAVQQVLQRLPAPPAKVILAGHGDFLMRRVLAECGISVPIVSLAEKLGPELSRCATAYAVAVLAREAGDA